MLTRSTILPVFTVSADNTPVLSSLVTVQLGTSISALNFIFFAIVHTPPFWLLAVGVLSELVLEIQIFDIISSKYSEIW